MEVCRKFQSQWISNSKNFWQEVEIYLLAKIKMETNFLSKCYRVLEDREQRSSTSRTNVLLILEELKVTQTKSAHLSTCASRHSNSNLPLTSKNFPDNLASNSKRMLSSMVSWSAVAKVRIRQKRRKLERSWLFTELHLSSTSTSFKMKFLPKNPSRNLFPHWKLNSYRKARKRSKNQLSIQRLYLQ